MFIGHYGVAFAVKARAPSLKLSVLFMAVQALDLLFAAFLLLGAEHMRVVARPVSAKLYDVFQLYDMHLSHSLVGALAWGLLATLVARLRLRWPAAAWLGVAVFSHFVLDIPMHPNDGLHPADLHVAGAASPGIGLGLWNHPALAVMSELGTFWVGLAIFARWYWPFSRRLWAMVIFLSAMATLPLFIPAGGTPKTFAVQILVMTLALAGGAGWVERPLAGRAKVLSA